MCFVVVVGGGHYHYVTDDIFNRGTEPDATDNLNC